MAEAKNVHAGHRQRMRERFKNGGFTNYQPHEVLEQFLFEAVPRGNTNVTAHLLLERFGSLDGVFHASKEELIEVNGIGEKSAELILSVYPEIGRRMLNQFMNADSITVYDIVLMFDWFIKQCRDDRVYIMLLGENGKLLDFTPLPHELDFSPFAVSEIAASHTGAEVMYLAAGKKESLCANFVEEAGQLTQLCGCTLSDAFYMTENGFASVKNPDDVLDIYAPKPSSRPKIKAKTKAQFDL